MPSYNPMQQNFSTPQSFNQNCFGQSNQFGSFNNPAQTASTQMGTSMFGGLNMGPSQPIAKQA